MTSWAFPNVPTPVIALSDRSAAVQDSLIGARCAILTRQKEGRILDSSNSRRLYEGQPIKENTSEVFRTEEPDTCVLVVNSTHGTLLCLIEATDADQVEAEQWTTDEHLEDGKLTINPASRIKRKAEHNDRIRFLSDKEETKLTGAIRENWPHYLPAFLISIHSGMRSGEQFGLQWAGVSLTRKTITLHRTKAGKTRHVRLNAIALAAFQELQTSRHPHGSVFVNTEGQQLRSSRDWFEPAVKLAGLNDYTWHCNRHTFASRLVMAGVDIRTVAQLMGHSTIQMTMRYAHLAPEHTQSAVDRLVRTSESLVTKSVTGRSARKR